MSTRTAPLPTPDAATILSARLGARAVDDLAARQGCALGGVVPSLVARPDDDAELAAMVAAVDEAGAALVPLGRGAHRALGHPPARYDLALVTDRLARVRDYTPADMTVTVEAGVTLADLATLLAREGQWLPIEPALPAETTVGGLLAADLAGPLAASQGRARDFAIGIGVVTAAGTLARAGGRVVKNVAGYDLMKLFIGSLGTLGVLTEATFKVRPLPEAQRCLVFTTGTVATALELGASVGATRPEAMAVTVVADLESGEREVTTVVRLGGAAADVALARAHVGAVAARHAAVLVLDAGHEEPAAVPYLAAVRDFPARAAGDLMARVAVLPARLPALVADAGRVTALQRGTWHVDPLRGACTLALTSEAPAAVLASLAGIAGPHDGHVVAERWPLALAPTVEVWRPLPPALPLMRRMKAALDPAGTFAGGRFVGRL